MVIGSGRKPCGPVFCSEPVYLACDWSSEVRDKCYDVVKSQVGCYGEEVAMVRTGINKYVGVVGVYFLVYNY